MCGPSDFTSKFWYSRKRCDGHISITLLTHPSALPQAVRTRSSHYFVYGLLPWMRADWKCSNGLSANHVSEYTGPQGQTLAKAVSFLLPYATGEKPIPFGDIDPDRYVLLCNTPL